MVDNKFTTKTIKGVFGNISKFMQGKREEKKEERRIDNLQLRQEHKDNTKYYNQAYIDEAREYQREKARQVINSNAHLAQKIKAINELHKDHRQPKINPTIQEIADRAYVNRYKKDMRLERLNMLKRVINEDKENKRAERLAKLEALNQSSINNRLNQRANAIIQKTKIQLRNNR